MAKALEGKFFHIFKLNGKELPPQVPFLQGKVISWITPKLLLVEIYGGKATKPKRTSLFFASIKEVHSWTFYDTEQEWIDAGNVILIDWKATNGR